MKKERKFGLKEFPRPLYRGIGGQGNIFYLWGYDVETHVNTNQYLL